MLPAVGIPQSLLGRAIRAETPRHQIIFVDMLLYSPCFLSPTPPTFCAVAPFVITQPRQRENNGRKYNKKYLGVMARLDFPPFYRQVRYGVFLCVGVPISFMSSVLKGRERGGGASRPARRRKKAPCTRSLSPHYRNMFCKEQGELAAPSSQVDVGVDATEGQRDTLGSPSNPDPIPEMERGST